MKPNNIIPGRRIWVHRQATTPTINWHWWRACKRTMDGKVALLNQLANKYPNSPYAINALYEKAVLMCRAATTAKLSPPFRELLNKYPESPVSRKAAAEIGLLYYQNDDYDRAIEAYKYMSSPNTG